MNNIEKILKNKMVNKSELASKVFPNKTRAQAQKVLFFRKEFSYSEVQAIKYALQELKRQIENL